MKNFYLAGTILGGVVPYLFFLDFFADEGVDLPTFIEALFANGAALLLLGVITTLAVPRLRQI